MKTKKKISKSLLFVWVAAFAILAVWGVAFAEETAKEKELRTLVEKLINQNNRLSQRLCTVEKELAHMKQEKETEVPLSSAQEETGAVEAIKDHISISGLLEFGGALKQVDFNNGEDDSASDLAMTTVEIDVEASINEWINAELALLYEDPTFANEETSIDLDAAVITLGNTEKYPFYAQIGVMYVPFGALFEHFPDDPLIDVPLALALGETREKAILLGYEAGGFAAAAYAFNGDVDQKDHENHINSYGFDAHYEADESDLGIGLLIGASYISNITDSDGLTDAIGEEIEDYVAGFDAYLHMEYKGMFFDVEYMTALDDFEKTELSSNNSGARPSVWNFEVGFNYNWWRNLEVAFKYAGSDEAEGLGFPESRYGINFNQELFENVTASLGYLHDEYEDGDADDRDSRDLVFWQLAVEF